jgi:hypothetical protein
MEERRASQTQRPHSAHPRTKKFSNTSLPNTMPKNLQAKAREGPVKRMQRRWCVPRSAQLGPTGHTRHYDGGPGNVHDPHSTHSKYSCTSTPSGRLGLGYRPWGDSVHKTCRSNRRGHQGTHTKTTARGPQVQACTLALAGTCGPLRCARK